MCNHLWEVVSVLYDFAFVEMEEMVGQSALKEE